jgi:hypothetical protein
MDPEIEKIIKEQMEKLPIEVKKLFTDSSLGEKIINIGKKNGLNEGQLAILQTETNLVMLGLVHPDEYSDELKSHLNINDIRADNITNDINTEIMSGIREKIKETYEKTEESLETEPDWKQNLDFVLSGGDYSSFIERRDAETSTSPADNVPKTNVPIKPGKMDPVRSREGSQRPSTSNGMDDIKSRFNI